MTRRLSKLHRARLSHSIRSAYANDPKLGLTRSRIMKSVWRRKEYRRKKLKQLKRMRHCKSKTVRASTRHKLSLAGKLRYTNAEERRKTGELSRGHKLSRETRVRLSLEWQKHHSPLTANQRLKMSVAQRKRFSNPKEREAAAYRASIQAINYRPSKIEKLAQCAMRFVPVRWKKGWIQTIARTAVVLSSGKNFYPFRHSVDIVIASHKIAIEIDGCWPHGCTKCFPAQRGSHFCRSHEIDRINNIAIKRAGWRVIRIPSHAFKTEKEFVGILRTRCPLLFRGSRHGTTN